MLELDFFSMAQGCDLFVKGEKNTRLTCKFFSPRLSIQSKHLQDSSIVEGSPLTAIEQVKRT